MTGDLAQLGRARDAWLADALVALEADDGILGAALVGSLGRGDADAWSDVDLVVVVPDERVGVAISPMRLIRLGDLEGWIDAPHNTWVGAAATSGFFRVDGFHLRLDLYAHPASQAAWPADALICFDRPGLSTSPLPFAELNSERASNPVPPLTDERERLGRLSMLPIVAKAIVRRSPTVPGLLAFVGATAPSTPLAMLDELDRLLELDAAVAPALADSIRVNLALARSTLS